MTIGEDATFYTKEKTLNAFITELFLVNDGLKSQFVCQIFYFMWKNA